MRMTDAPVLMGRQFQVLAPQPCGKTFSPNASPKVSHGLPAQAAELFERMDSAFFEALFHFGPDAGQIARGQMKEVFRQLGLLKNRQAVWFLHVARQLSEET